MSDEAERMKLDDFETKEVDGERVPDQKGIVTHWLAELQLAARTEKDWQNEADAIWKRYKAEKAAAEKLSSDEATFNILWSNTEIFVPALYNSTPAPDVRRRFKDKDPVGRYASTVIERGLTYSIDTYDFDDEIVGSTLDMVLVGRGVARIRYRPQVQSVETPEAKAPEAKAPADTAAGAAEEPGEPSSTERIVRQDTTCEHVQWKDFRRGPGKRWRDVPWVAFRHDMTYDDLVEYFGEERANGIPLTQLSDADSSGMDDKSAVKRLFQSGEVWEIWDRMKRRVLFIAQGSAEPLLVDTNPTLKLRGFFPMPRPAYAILDTTSLVPIPLYRQYRSQADEIEMLTRRIEKVSYALRVRGAYLGNIKEIPMVMDAGDNEMVAIEDAGGAIAQIGLDKAIWLMPVEKLVAVLEGLYKARDQAKQTVYEIMGLSDIMRGASKATETLGAQELKSRWGSVRLQRMQKEIQRFVRDLLRLKGEVIAEQYEPEVLAEMTQVKLPRAAEKAQLQAGLDQAQQSYQKVSAQAQATNQPPPPPPDIPPNVKQVLALPTWEEVIAVLRSDSMRQYRINIESDSTVAETIERDMRGLREVIESLGAVFASIPALQQAGAKNAPVVAKDIALSLVRQARFGGRAVEDSIESMEFGQPQGDVMQAVQQIGQAVQKSAQQLAQMGERMGQHDQALGQIVKTLQALPTAPPPAGPPAPAARPMGAMA